MVCEIDVPKGDVVFKMETVVPGESFTIESFKIKGESSDVWRDVVGAQSLKIEGKTAVSVSGHVGSSQEYDELSGDIPADSFIRLYLSEHRN